MPIVDNVTETRSAAYQALKSQVHQDLLNRLNLDRLTQTSRADAEPEIRAVIRSLLDLQSQKTPLSLAERESLVNDVLNELFGLGPLEVLLRDPDISDILVNRASQVFIERNGRIEETDVIFRDDRHLMQIIERIVSAVGRRIDESQPMVDARLQDGSRVNAIIPPLALDGPVLSIRRFRTDRLGADDLVTRESLTVPMLAFLRAAVTARLNIVVSGGTGAGKTTLLNVLSSFIDSGERVITVEDAAELTLRQRHVVRLETRPANIEGKGSVRQRDLVINALRMRPDRIIVGEVRGEEALDMLQAMNTGHDGSLTTIHANSPRDALYRLDTMVAMTNLNIPEKAVRQQIASAVNLVIQVARMPDGTRKVTSVSEITGMEQDVITMQEIFNFQRTGASADGRVLGQFRATGIRPRCSEALAMVGQHFPMDMFEHRQWVGGEDRVEAAMTLPITTFLAFFAGILLIYWFFVVRPEGVATGRVRRRLSPTDAVKARIRSGLLKQQDALSAFKPVDLLLRRSHARTASLQRLIEQSGVPTTPGTVVAAAALVALVCGYGAGRATGWVTVGIAAAMAGAVLPFHVLRRVRGIRLRKFEEQFPEVLDLIARALRAGHAFTTGLEMVATELPAPAAQEFRLLFDQQSYGMPLPQALKAFADRIDVLDARFFVTAVLIQRESGGNLSEVLDNLSSVIRERFRVKRQMRVVSAQGRITGAVLVALPPVLGLALMGVNEEHRMLMFTDPLGVRMLIGAAVLQVLGTLLIRKIVDVEY